MRLYENEWAHMRGFKSWVVAPIYAINNNDFIHRRFFCQFIEAKYQNALIEQSLTLNYTVKLEIFFGDQCHPVSCMLQTFNSNSSGTDEEGPASSLEIVLLCL